MDHLVLIPTKIVLIIHLLSSCAHLYISQTPIVVAAAPIPGNDTDHLALLSFKSFVKEDPTQTLASWNGSFHFCQWPGVTCGGRPERVRALDLVSLDLAGLISPFLSNLTFLRRLRLQENRFHGTIPQELGRLSQLRNFNLSSNSLEGEIPSTLSSNCENLQFVGLAANFFHGEIPANFSHCTNLVFLNLGRNMLVGEIPPEFNKLQVLEALTLSRNNLTGLIPSGLGNLSSLVYLDLKHNNLCGRIPAELGRVNSFEVLDLGHNNLSGAIPDTIYNLSSLMTLCLPDNHLVGTLPRDLGRTFPNLIQLYLYKNQLMGEIPSTLSNASNLRDIQLNNNTFNGLVPSNFGTLEHLSILQISSNNLEAGKDWRFLTSLANCSQLRLLDLSDNNLEGTLPNVIGNLSSWLQELDFTYNQIYGSIPSEIGNLVSLTSLRLDQNVLTGTIPGSIGGLHELQVLILSGNELSGVIPSSLGHLSLLLRLDLSSNNLAEDIPLSFQSFQNLQNLDLSYNNLNGTIPNRLVGLPSSLIALSLSHNSLHGSLPAEFGGMENIGLLWLSYNKLSGQIPGALGKCQVLEYLHMENNLFEGAVPTPVAELKGLRFLDLSSNNLSGPVPEFGSRVLEYLNLSFNHFEGQVPSTGVFQNTSGFSIIGNRDLCGGVQELHLPECNTQATRKSLWKSSRLKIMIAVFSVVATLCLVCVFYLLTKWTPSWMSRNSPMVASIKDQHSRISYSDLNKATNGFSQENMIGMGSFGSVYKGVLDHDGKVVAVKVLNLKRQGVSKSFIQECDALRNIRHRNLVKILSSCSSLDFKGNEFKALIFEFMSNGSLDDWLHPQENGLISHMRILNLNARLNIAIDVAFALEYLHLGGDKPLVHCDLKPSNVLLDDAMTAHVGDFGLARFLPKNAGKSIEISTVAIKGTIGYIAPEYGMNGQVSTYGDIYSYGILLLEMFTGKRPTDDTFEEGLSLREFAELSFPERIIDIIDPQLLELEERGTTLNDEAQETCHGEHGVIHECLVSLIKVGLLCSKECPLERMKIGDVIKEIHAIEGKLTRIEVSKF